MKPIFILFLLLLPCQIIAQDSTHEPSVWIGGSAHNSTIIGNYFKTVIVNNITVTQIDSIAIRDIARSEIQPVKNAIAEELRTYRSELESVKQETESVKQNFDEHEVRITRLETQVSILGGALSEIKKREAELEEKNWSYLPLGIHQFTHKEIGSGIFFAATEIGSIYGAIRLAHEAKETDDLYKNEPYQSEIRHRELKNSRNCKRVGAGACALAAVAFIAWNYYENCRPARGNDDVCLSPTVILDYQGRPQMAMTFNVKF